MTNFNQIDKKLLQEIADLHTIPQGSFNIRKNGLAVESLSTEDIKIMPKSDKSGIDVFVREETKNKSVHLPVIITVGGFSDLVHNDFYIEKNAEVTIVAGCGIHNPSDQKSEHNGLHNFHLDEGCKVKYLEKHLGSGNGLGDKILNPVTNIEMKKNSYFEMETIQLGGVSYSKRQTKAKLFKKAKLVIKEKILTDEKQKAVTKFEVILKGKESSVEVISRSVAKGDSKQEFYSNIIGKTDCFGHVECDGIVLDQAKVISVPKISAESGEATLVHEAAIGKIAGEQLVKLQTLGLTEEEAKDQIIKGFLR